MFFPFYSKKKLLLAFEYGLVFAEAARELKHEITPELSKRFEEMLLNEFSKKSATTLAVDMYPNILSIFDTSMDK